MMTTIDAKTLTFAELQAEVGEWSKRNFPNNTANDPFEGVVEELGELAHARLKTRQGIRGTKEEHEAAEKDAIGDIIIYLMDYCERGFTDLILDDEINETFADEYNVDLKIESFDDLECATKLVTKDRVNLPDEAFRTLVERVGDLANYGTSYYVGSILVVLATYCHGRGFSLAAIVAETWEQVRQRDWTANKVDGQTG